MDKEYTNVFFCTVDVDDPNVSSKYDVNCLPTFLFFKDGKHVMDLKIEGANEQEIRNSLNII
jgi:thiol-disulfide isomerase/thioredoxin